jgi:WD40 repeat protein
LTYLQTIYLDTDAFAVDINPDNGLIAIAIGTQVHIYEPMNEFMTIPRWQFLTKLINDEDTSHVNALNWGSNNEIIVGSDYLTLWQVKKDFGVPKPLILWSLIQANPVYLVKISQDSTSIASCSQYDKLLKVWNRLSFGENTNFDLTYLHHTSSISMIRWKFHSHKDLDYTNVLYSLSDDQILRVWSSFNYENSQNIQIWGNLRLKTDEKPVKKFAVIVDDHIVTNCLKANIGKLYKDEVIDLQDKRQPDLVLVIDEFANVEVFALGNLSQNPPKMMTIKSLKKLRFDDDIFTKNPEVINFPEIVNDPQNDISLIVHDLHGTIRNIKIDLNFLLNNSDAPIGKLTHKLTGHNKSIQRILRTSDGEAMITTSRFEENSIWIPQKLTNQVTLKKKSIVHTPHPILQAVLFEKGDILLTVCGKNLILWDSSNKIAKQLDVFKLSHKEDPLFFSSLPLKQHDHLKHYVIAIYGDSTSAFIINDTKIQLFAIDELPIDIKDVNLIAPIDPVGQIYQNDRPIISIIDSKGILKCFASEIQDGRIKWILRNNLDSQICDSSYIRGSSISKFAIVDHSKLKLTIWDLNRNVLEYEETFTSAIRDIDWTSTANKQSILSVGFEDSSLLYTQQRYDYTNNTPTFQVIKKIDIKNFTPHAIGDSIWLKDGTLVIGAGNQMFISDKQLDLINDKFTRKSIGSRNIVTNDIFNLSSVLNGSLPLYHPQFLIQLLFQGRLEITKEILLRLFLKVRELETKGENIDSLGSTLGFNILKLFEDRYDGSDCSQFEEPFNVFNSYIGELLKEKLTNISLPYLTRHQQITLVSTIETLETTDQNVMSLDDNGLRFFLGVKLFQVHKGGLQSKLTMRDINWALHSENKELLLKIIENSIKNKKFTWSAAKEYGLAYWVKYDEMVQTIETIARNEFTLPTKRDPGNCAIYYLALKKKQILTGLWKTSAGHPEQQKMLNFLKNDFREKRWRSAALKNAFVLLSKHRFMDAACFFLLADSLKDAVNVLIKQVNDLDLAIAVCRVYEGDNGPVLQSVLTQHLLSIAVSNGDRWTTSYIYWKLKDKSRSIQSLVKSPVELITAAERSKITLTEKSKSFLEDDPLLIVLYKNLREKNLHYFHGSLEIPARVEFEFILRVCNIYTRMGCDYLSVGLLKHWNFLKHDDAKPKKGKAINGIPTSPTSNKIGALEKYGLSSAVRRRSSLLVEDRDDFLVKHLKDVHHETQENSSLSILEKYGLASNSIKREEESLSKGDHQKTGKKHTPPPQDAFQEPDMSAFNFGF